MKLSGVWHFLAIPPAVAAGVAFANSLVVREFSPYLILVVAGGLCLSADWDRITREWDAIRRDGGLNL